MSIGVLLKEETAFGPEDISAITAAFEDALKRLNVAEPEDAMATLIAQKIIQAAKEGERNPTTLVESVIQVFRDNPIPDVNFASGPEESGSVAHPFKGGRRRIRG